MKVRFYDLADKDNELNGTSYEDANLVLDLIDELRRAKPPFGCWLVGSNGFTLTLGVGNDFGFAQHARSDGLPPYMMAVYSDTGKSNACEGEFDVGGTPTPIDGRYILSFEFIKEVVREFINRGERSTQINWEEY
jgi:hypothetical protein